MNSIVAFFAGMLQATIAFFGFAHPVPSDVVDQSSQVPAQGQSLAPGDVVAQYGTLPHGITTPTPTPVKTPAAKPTNSGMSKYSDTNFGYSFWYPSAWRVSVAEKLSPSLAGDVSTRRLQVVSDKGVRQFIIEEVTATNSVFTRPIAAIRGCRLMYFFNSSEREWMQDTTGCDHMESDLHQANVIGNTMGGLPMFQGTEMQTIVPLSARNFISVIYAGEEARYSKMNESYLTKTIEAVDLSAGNPVSPAQQTAIIQAEKNVYTAQ